MLGIKWNIIETKDNWYLLKHNIEDKTYVVLYFSETRKPVGVFSQAHYFIKEDSYIGEKDIII